MKHTPTARKTQDLFRFGEDSIDKMTDWAVENVPIHSNPSILEVGSGNGTLLFALHEVGYSAKRICGVDYSEDAIELAQAISRTKGEGATDITFGVCDFLKDYPPPYGDSPDVLECVGIWDLIFDKGTFDAMVLSGRDKSGHAEWERYPSRITQALGPGGYLLITCMGSYVSLEFSTCLTLFLSLACNFTEEELRTKFSNAETGLEYQ